MAQTREHCPRREPARSVADADAQRIYARLKAALPDTLSKEQHAERCAAIAAALGIECD